MNMRIDDKDDLGLDLLGAGRMNRRAFLKAGAAVGLGSTILAPLAARAADKPAKIVHANWGGEAQRCYLPLAKQFTDANGVPVVIDGSGPAFGRIKQMVEAKNVVWDVVDQDFFYGIMAGRAGLLEPVDYSIVDKSKIRDADKYATQYGAPVYWYSNVLTYNKAKVGNDLPKTWADFYDIKKYPGKRGCYKYGVGVLEGALMADGVPPEKVYPMDVDRAIAKIKTIKEYLVPWQNGADGQDMLLHGDVVMSEMWHPRAVTLDHDTKGEITWTYNQGIMAPGGWFILKGNPAGVQWASKWIAQTQDAKDQVDVLACLGMAPAGEAGTQMEKPEDYRSDPTRPENAKVQIVIDSNYYADNYFAFLQKFLEVLS